MGEGNIVFLSEWDNLNKTTNNTTNVYGSNIVNSTGGIMVQKVKPGSKSPSQNIAYNRKDAAV